MQAEKNVTVERNKRGAPVALVSAGTRYPVKRGSFVIPRAIADGFALADLTPEIIIDFIDKEHPGISFRAIQHVKGNQGEVVLMVRHTLADWKSPVSLQAYFHALETLVKNREDSSKDVAFLTSHIRADHGLVAFVARVSGTTVEVLLRSAYKIAEGIISPLFRLEMRVEEEIKMITSSAIDGGVASKEDLGKN